MARARPTGIVLIVIWFFLSGFGYTLTGAGVAFLMADVFRLIGLISPSLGTQSLQLTYTLLGLVLMATGIGKLVLGWGLLEGRSWAQLWGVVAAGVSALGWLAVWVIPLVAGSVFSSVVILLIVPAIPDLLALIYLLGEEARVYCSGYAPAVGQWQPIQQETVPATRPEPPPPPQPPVPPRTELVAPPTPTVAWLVSRLPGRAGRQFPLQAGRNTLGRDGSRCQVVLDDPTVSGEHAAIVFEQGRFVLYDLASTNGTYLNGQRAQRQMLYDGDEIRLGNSVLVFKKV